METHIRINENDKVEILTLQDNYIDLMAMDNSDIIQRALPLKDGNVLLNMSGTKLTFSA